MIEWLNRIGRPVFIRILLPCALVWFIWELGARMLRAMDRAIDTGQPIPDMTGGLTTIVIAVLGLVGPLLTDQITRSRERERQIERGQAPGPFGQPSSNSSAPPFEGVNPHGGPGTP